MRVLTVITSIEAEVGGPSFVVANAVAAERAAGVHTDLAFTVPRRGGGCLDLADRVALTGASQFAFPRPRCAASLAQRWGVSLPMVMWLLRQSRHYDVLHVHYVWALSTVATIVAGAVWRKPVVLTPHESLTDFGIETSRTQARGRQKRILRDLLLRGVAVVAVSSELERRDSHAAGSKAVVIPHPVESMDSGHGGRTSGDSSQGVTFGYLGRLHEKKRVDLLVAAISRLPVSARLVVGGGEPENELRRLRAEAERAGVHGRIDFRGFLRSSDRAAFFSNIDILVMPSTYECFGMAAAEAMAAGVPVVVSDQTGVAVTVREYGAGFVFPVDETDELERVLDSIAADPDKLHDAAARAREAALATYSFEAYSRRTFGLYSGLLGERLADARR